jgi:hypothetical protein
MHRIEDWSGDTVTESGHNRFKDRALPTYPGTIDKAEFNNAVMEELCYIVENYGGDCDIAPSADRTAGWHAVHDAIFSDGNITSDAIDNISLDKLSIGTLSIVSGIYRWDQAFGGLVYQKDTSGTVYQHTTLNNEGIHIDSRNGDPDDDVYLTIDGLNCRIENSGGTATLLQTIYGPRGITYTEGPGNVSAFESANVRKAVFDLSSASWTLDAGNVYYYGADLDSSGIPDTAEVYSAFAKVSYASGGFSRLHPADVRPSANGGYLELLGIRIVSTSVPDDGCQLIIEYDASSVS